MECDCSFQDSSYLGTTCGLNPNVTLFMSLVDLMLRSSCRIAQPCHRTTVNRNAYNYDFIVVGGGVAGPVVASRLSENKKWKVLLLEAGPEEPTTTSVPAFAVRAIGTHLDWQYTTEKEENACLSTFGYCHLPRGKMMGGTGSLSGMMFMRGHKDIFNNWSKEGNVGWTYYECLQFFKKAENNLDPDIIEKPFHGTFGPLTVSRFSYQPAFVGDLIEAGKILGYADQDLNGHNQTGITIAQMMNDRGVRASTPRMYLRDSRRNFFVYLNSTVSKVIIDKQSKKAVGVEYFDENGRTHVAYAKKEIILSAGAFGSPHILMLSGVGPAEELKKHKIDVIQDLPVGKNLHNHVSIEVDFLVKDKYHKEILTLNTLNEYLVNQTGPLASTGLTQVTAFMHTKYSPRIPDIQMFFDGFIPTCPLFSKHYPGNISPDDEILVKMRPTNIMTKSVGYLTLQSKNPKQQPRLFFNYLSERLDIEVLKEGIKLAIKLSETEPLQKWGMRLDTTPKNKCSYHIFGSDSYWECLIKYYTGPENHPAGTCKMGPLSSKGAVVDPELRVHGITNLRVIDASAFPYVPNSNPMASIVMLAEKGAHMIYSAWGCC